MNEFTKDELKGILEALHGIDNNPFLFTGTRWDESLKDKIQFMIDHYCEHEWNLQEIMLRLVVNPGEAYPVLCKKCGVTY